MNTLPDLEQITLGILTWKLPGNLLRTLRSYKSSGLIQSAGEVILFVNAADPREIALGKKFGLSVIHSADNIGIGPAFAQLAQAATKPYFMFLENDWVCIEPRPIVERRLGHGLGILQSHTADAVRFRHRVQYGHPLYSRKNCEGRELESANRPHLLDAVHWNKMPSMAFPDYIKHRQLDGEDWYLANSADASYTNNPCLYHTDFARDEIAPRGMIPGIGSEVQLQDWWQKRSLTVAQGEGLFKHHDPGKEWRRARSILRGIVKRDR